MIRSFDIFDTCLTRRVSEPAEVFDQMAERLGLGADFRFRRQEAEIEAERRQRNATLEEIYQILGEWSAWSEERRSELERAELEEEGRQLIPVLEMKNRIAALHAEGFHLEFVSDMYLPSPFLRAMLVAHGFWAEGDTLWVSCEARMSKAEGSLFKQVAARSGGVPVEHTGNHAHSDVRAAERAGLRGRAYTRANLTIYEQMMAAWPTSCGTQWAAASREARVSLGGLSEPAHAIAAVSSGVVAPLLLSYVHWLCGRALAHRLDRIYFLARDGQILKEIYEQVAPALGLSCEARYLHASRISLRFPRSFPMTDTDANGVFQADQNLPLDVIALRLGLEPDQLASLLPEDCVTGGNIPRRQFQKCRTALETPEACVILNQVAVERNAILQDYLVQEGWADGCRFGVCDLGWGGTLQFALRSMCESIGAAPDFPGFYLGLITLPDPAMSAEAYAFDFRLRHVNPPPWFVLAAEVFSQADHGSTIGFLRNEHGRIQPCLDEPDGDNPLVPDWLQIHRSGVRAFVNGVLRRRALVMAPASLARHVVRTVQRFSFRPSTEEANAWGSCHFSSHGSASSKTALAPRPRTPKDLLWVAGIRFFGTGNSLWPHGAAVRLPQPLRTSLRLLHRIQDRLKPSRW